MFCDRRCCVFAFLCGRECENFKFFPLGVVGSVDLMCALCVRYVCHLDFGVAFGFAGSLEFIQIGIEGKMNS